MIFWHNDLPVHSWQVDRNSHSSRRSSSRDSGFLRSQRCLRLIPLFIFVIFYLDLSNNAEQNNPFLKDSSPIPVHYVWIENRRSEFNRDLTALQYLSLLSALENIAPVSINLHTNANFSGPLWDALKSKVTVRPITRVGSINGKPVEHIQQEADIVKLDIAHREGGLFVDFDIYFVGKRDEFLSQFANAECLFTTFERENRPFFAIGNFACKPKSEFIRRIIGEYHSNFKGYACYSDTNPIPYLYNGCLYPYLLRESENSFRESVKFTPGLLNIFPNRNDFLKRSGKVDWKSAFNVHSGYEGKDLTLYDIFQLESSFGEMLRWIYNKSSKTGGKRPNGCTQEARGIQLRKKDFPSGFADLSTLQYISGLSAIKYGKVAVVEIISDELIVGPLWEDLLSHATRLKVTITNCNIPENAANGYKVRFKLDTYFLKEYRKSRRPYVFTRKDFAKDGKLDLGAERFAIVQTGYDKKDMSPETIRKLRGPFGDLLRLVLFNSIEPVRDFPLRRMKCS